MSSPGDLEGPVFSLILCARNDSYQGNSLWRLETALNYTCRSIAELGREGDVEVIVVDWGSDDPLEGALRLTPAAARAVRFLDVPAEIVQEVQQDSPFAEVLALNAAARRSLGQYIGRIDQDTLVGTSFFERLFAFHERGLPTMQLRRALLLSNRRTITVRFTGRSPSLWVVDRYVRWFGRLLPLMDPLPPELFYRSYVGIWMLHRDVWAECEGYDERFIYMDEQEVDMMLRLVPEYTLVNLGELTGHDLYHLNHGPARVPWSSQRNRKVNPLRDFDHLPEDKRPNGANWGLMQHPLTVHSYGGAIVASDGPEGSAMAEWSTFISLVAVSTLQAAGDKAIVFLATVWRVALRPATWASRLRVARSLLAGQPPSKWPGLLVTRWRDRAAYRG